MLEIVSTLANTLRPALESRQDLVLENLALRHQLAVLTCSDGRPRFRPAYYHRTRTHLSLGKDSPDTRPAQPPAVGKIVELPQVGGLHHRYERRAA